MLKLLKSISILSGSRTLSEQERRQGEVVEHYVSSSSEDDADDHDGEDGGAKARYQQDQDQDKDQDQDGVKDTTTPTDREESGLSQHQESARSAGLLGITVSGRKYPQYKSLSNLRKVSTLSNTLDYKGFITDGYDNYMGVNNPFLCVNEATAAAYNSYC